MGENVMSEGILPFDFVPGAIPIKLATPEKEKSPDQDVKKTKRKSPTISPVRSQNVHTVRKVPKSKDKDVVDKSNLISAKKTISATKQKTAAAIISKSTLPMAFRNSLLARYNDVPDYPEGSFHPKDFDYHRPASCGERGTGTIDESFRDNGIRCDIQDYAMYTQENPAPDEIKDNLKKSRQKACNCEVERRMTNQHMQDISKDQDQLEHIFPMNKAAIYCKKCAQLERELMTHGYIKDYNEETGQIRHDGVVALMMLMHSLRSGQQDLWSASPGVTAHDKLVHFMWNEYLPKQPLLKNLKKNMTFAEFKRSLGAVTTFLDEKNLQKKLNKLSKKKSRKLSRYAYTRKKALLLSKKKQLIKNIVSLRKKK